MSPELRSQILAYLRRCVNGASAAKIAARFGLRPIDIRGELISLSRAGEIVSEGNTRAAKWVAL